MDDSIPREEVERLITDLKAGRLSIKDQVIAGKALDFYLGAATRMEKAIHRLTK